MKQNYLVIRTVEKADPTWTYLPEQYTDYFVNDGLLVIVNEKQWVGVFPLDKLICFAAMTEEEFESFINE